MGSLPLSHFVSVLTDECTEKTQIESPTKFMDSNLKMSQCFGFCMEGISCKMHLKKAFPGKVATEIRSTTE